MLQTLKRRGLRVATITNSPTAAAAAATTTTTTATTTTTTTTTTTNASTKVASLRPAEPAAKVVKLEVACIGQVSLMPRPNAGARTNRRGSWGTLVMA